MSAHAAKNLADIWVELGDDTNSKWPRKIKVEALKYYQPIEGGCKEVNVPITTASTPWTCLPPVLMAATWVSPPKR